jgi:hypothetical protein
VGYLRRKRVSRVRPAWTVESRATSDALWRGVFGLAERTGGLTDRSRRAAAATAGATGLPTSVAARTIVAEPSGGEGQHERSWFVANRSGTGVVEDEMDVERGGRSRRASDEQQPTDGRREERGRQARVRSSTEAAGSSESNPPLLLPRTTDDDDSDVDGPSPVPADARAPPGRSQAQDNSAAAGRGRPSGARPGPPRARLSRRPDVRQPARRRPGPRVWRAPTARPPGDGPPWDRR